MPHGTIAEEVLDFWLGDGETFRPEWFQQSDALDAEIEARFGDAMAQAAAGGYDGWIETARATVALIVLLDQFPRNVFRGRAEAFAQDAKARATARWAVSIGHDRGLPKYGRLFLYLPFEHSELIGDQRDSVRLIEGLDDPELLRYAIAHLNVIQEFGRFPHRNAALGRVNTPEEDAYLAQPGAGF